MLFLFLFLASIKFVYATSHVTTDHDEKVLKAPAASTSYRVGERFLVECLNRTLDTGEHVRTYNGHAHGAASLIHRVRSQTSTASSSTFPSRPARKPGGPSSSYLAARTVRIFLSFPRTPSKKVYL